MAANRLDQLLVDLGHYETRARARDAIKRGCVSVDGVVTSKPAASARPEQSISIVDDAHQYVSRAALKLIAGLEYFDVDPHGRICLDIGASTGGFSQVLLERGATTVYAVDVGHGQLARSLQKIDKLISLEKLNARELEAGHLNHQKPELIVSDVSFISLKLAIPPALALANKGAICILLVKPQFEVGRAMIGKNGLVAPDTAHGAAADLRNWLDGLPSWRSLGLIESPIKGGDGNMEFLLAGRKDG
ncbi:MAG: TlyA family RNA methyltransferase [Pseudomonadota bacterium]